MDQKYQHVRSSSLQSLKQVPHSTLSLLAPIDQIQHLVDSNESERWVKFREGFLQKWSQLNIVSGLIMSAVATVVFSSLELSRTTFAFGIISLLSSLISIGFATGLTIVLGNVPPEIFDQIAKRYPRLFSFCLSIPQVWAWIGIHAFFISLGIFAWHSATEGVLTKIGIIGASVLAIGHLVAFVVLYRRQLRTNR